MFGLFTKSICAGLLLAGLQQLPGSAIYRPDPYGLVRLGLASDAGSLIEPTRATWRVRVTPNPVADEVSAALTAYQAGNIEAALSTLVRAVLVAPADWEARRALAGLLLDLQDNTGALAQYELLLKRNPEDPDLLYQRAWALQGLGQSPEALADVAEVVRQRPKWAQGWVRYGRILAALDNREEADNAFARAAAGSGIGPELRFEIGNYFLETGSPKEAIPQLKRALELKPDYSWAANNLGNAYKAAGDPRKAKQAYQLAVSADPDNPNPHNGIGVLQESLGDLVGALEHYRAATRSDSGYMDAHFNAGVVLLKLGRAREALDELETAVKLRPDFANIYFHMAAAHLRLGHRATATDLYHRAMLLDPALAKDNNLAKTLQREHP